MKDDLHKLMPKHKSDFAGAQTIIALGYPTVAPVLPDLLGWLADFNWPISDPISKFLISIPEYTAPLIWNVLRGDDYVWKYWCINQLVSEMPVHVAEQFRSELIRLVESPAMEEREEHLDEAAAEALKSLWSQ